MLGDIVECEFSAAGESRISVGEEIGSVEGFKAITAIFAVASGAFQGRNPDLDADITAVESDPYGRGWLYQVEGAPDPESVDVHGYVGILDSTIDMMLEQRHDGKTNDET
jgi:glycine cleavage system H protein